MSGNDKPGYRQPRTGEKRKTRQPFKLDRMKPEVRDAVVEARREGCTWGETATRASALAGTMIWPSVVHRWYDVRISQGQRIV